MRPAFIIPVVCRCSVEVSNPKASLSSPVGARRARPAERLLETTVNLLDQATRALLTHPARRPA
ncbi:hypothetical protein [Nocardia xishanensis]